MEAVTAQAENRIDPLRELVLSAQGGDREAMTALWEAVERFTQWEARRRWTLTGTVGGVDIDDLCQCGYEALVDAVGRYDPGKESASFLGLLSFRLKTAFSEAQGIRGHKEPLNLAISLDEEIGDDQSDDAQQTRADLIPDPQAEAEFAEEEEKIFQNELSKAVFHALDALPAVRREIVKDRFFRNLTREEIARGRGVTASAVREQEGAAIRQMRQQARKYGLDRFVEAQTLYYKHYGLSYMKNSGISPVEAICFDRERLRDILREDEAITR